MKSLIENSITVGKSPLPNIFNDGGDGSRRGKYLDLSTYGGENLRIGFQYAENEAVRFDMIPFTVPEGKTEEEIKSLIITAINGRLSA